jgi:hypothetical protein
MSFPWRPILSGNCSKFMPHLYAAKICLFISVGIYICLLPDMLFAVILRILGTGYTEYYFAAESGKVCRY